MINVCTISILQYKPKKIKRMQGMNETLNLYNSVGNEEFTNLLTAAAPYFGTISPVFTELKSGYASIDVPNTKEVHNHLGTVHAIAMCNAAELVAGTMTEVSIPETSRWIPSGMSVKYLKKAKTDLKAVAKGDGIDWSKMGMTEVPVSIFDTNGDEVFSAVITMTISPKK